MKVIKHSIRGFEGSAVAVSGSFVDLTAGGSLAGSVLVLRREAAQRQDLSRLSSEAINMCSGP